MEFRIGSDDIFINGSSGFPAEKRFAGFVVDFKKFVVDFSNI